MAQDDLMQGLIEAFADTDDEPADDAPALEATDADADADDDTAADTDAGAEEDAAEEDADGTAEEEPEGAKYLKLVGPDGKPRRVHIDELLSQTQHDIKVDGETRFVSYDELKAGYQRQADYTRKTMELAKERSESAPFSQMVAYAKTDPDFVRHVQNYFQHGPHPELQAAARADLADEQLAAMLDSGKTEAVQQAKQVLQARAQFRRMAAQRQQYEQQAQEQQRQMLERHLMTEREKVTQLIPDYPKQISAIAAALHTNYGFTEAELSNVYDARLVALAYDAMQYRKSLEQGTKIGLEGKRKAPPPPRAARPGVGKANASVRDERTSKELMARARKSGTTDDWTTLIAHRLGL